MYCISNAANIKLDGKMKTLTLEQKINLIDTDIRFGVCECYENGLYETSVFYNENFDGRLNKELQDKFTLCPRQEIAETVSKSVSYTLAYEETFSKFKVWLLKNEITHDNFDKM